ncbi:MAG: hypothetical protein HKK67_13345 [Chlorobiaceae bacterium]|nr:hypothetical protein [Chlorobiaceae bacterium]
MNKTLIFISVAVITVIIGGSGWFVFNKRHQNAEPVAIRVLESSVPTEWELEKKLTDRDILVEEGVKLKPIYNVQSGGGTVSLQALLANNVDTAGSAWPAWVEKHPLAVSKYIRAYAISRRIIYDECKKNPDRVRKAYADISVEKGGNPRLAKYYEASSWTPKFPLIVSQRSPLVD